MTSVVEKTGVGKNLVKNAIEGHYDLPRVILVKMHKSGAVTLEIDPLLTWDAIADFPWTMGACKTALDRA